MGDAQIEYWSGPAGQRWVTHQAALDRGLSNFGRAVLERADARPGERVLDVGCGCGDTTLALGQRVAPNGHVTGVDVSAAMLERARERAGGSPLQQFVLADAASFIPQPPSGFDLIFSRFGVMFFAEPEAAFANLRRLLRAAGRLTFVCWRALHENPWATLPLEIVQRALPEAPPLAFDEGPGPFSLADRARLEKLLAGAGFAAIAVERFDAEVVLATGEIADAVEFAMSTGPAWRLLAGAPPAALERARQALTLALAPQHTPRGFVLDGSTWLVSARAG